ncbi:MAG: DegT/DnrJ/EryC1/StrS aminotransferase family protein [FCB group bacterium]|nr:DegT/DnrJ/EryC1/StrS aminotransferase family protein [FCB group bacterium]
MPGLLTKYPPTAADLRIGDIIKARRSNRPHKDCLDDIAGYFQTKHPFGFNSGRTALYALLKACLPAGSGVVLPGYTCYTVAAAVVRAGMKVILSDSDPNDLGYNIKTLQKTLTQHSNIKAIVACHLFGLTLDLNKIRKIAGSDTLIIDDAAQSCGIQTGDHQSGTGGDVGFYSFGRGKPLSISGGGLLVTDNDDISDKVKKLIADEFEPDQTSLGSMMKAAVYNPAVHPLGFNLASRLPGIKLAQNRFDPEFPVSTLSEFKARLLAGILPRLDKMNQDRQMAASQLENLIGNRSGISIPRSKLDGRPGNLRFPILIDDSELRLRVLRKGRQWGFSSMYPTALNGLPSIAEGNNIDLPGAERIARTIVTLPTHRHILHALQNDSITDKLARLWR